MRTLRPSDLAREHAISTQAVRNYEQDGCLPPADRTPAGYWIYSDLHAAALRTYLTLIPAYGHAQAGDIMRALHARGDLHQNLPSTRSVGYRQAWLLIEGQNTFDEFRAAAIAATRQLAKRQMTWLRSMKDATVVEALSPGVLDEVALLIG